MATDSLTPKQEAFVREYMKTGNASEAYRQAYDAKGMKDAAIHVNACKLLKNAKVALRLAAWQQRTAKKHEITVDRITKMLEADRRLARKLEMPAAAVSASMGLAKLHGLIVEKRQNTNVNIDANQLSDAELEAIASGRSEELAAPTPGPLVTH